MGGLPLPLQTHWCGGFIHSFLSMYGRLWGLGQTSATGLGLKGITQRMGDKEMECLLLEILNGWAKCIDTMWQNWNSQWKWNKYTGYVHGDYFFWSVSAVLAIKKFSCRHCYWPQLSETYTALKVYISIPNSLFSFPLNYILAKLR